MTTTFNELAPHRAYLEGMEAGELRYMRCGDCDKAFFYPRVLCPHCGGTDVSWHVSAGLGSIYSVTVVADKTAPYSLALIDLDEGFRFMSNVDGTEAGIGDRVKARADRLEGARPRIIFERSGAVS